MYNILINEMLKRDEHGNSTEGANLAKEAMFSAMASMEATQDVSRELADIRNKQAKRIEDSFPKENDAEFAIFVEYWNRFAYDYAKANGVCCPHCGFWVIPEKRAAFNTGSDREFDTCVMCNQIIKVGELN